MILVENTPNNLGVIISGDYQDFERLYEALHVVVRDDEYLPAARLRVLGVCYDIRHALMGNRDYTFVPNGLTHEIKKHQKLAASDKNVYLVINVLWPEILFILYALNTFSLTYAKNITKEKYAFDLLTNPKLIWDPTYTEVRKFQAAIAESIKNTVTDHVYSRLLNTMNRRSAGVEGYFTQYIDLLNHNFMEMSAEKRLKNISIVAKRIVEKNDEYRQLEDEIRESARIHACSVDEIRLNLTYPEKMEW